MGAIQKNSTNCLVYISWFNFFYCVPCNLVSNSASVLYDMHNCMVLLHLMYRIEHVWVMTSWKRLQQSFWTLNCLLTADFALFLDLCGLIPSVNALINGGVFRSLHTDHQVLHQRNSMHDSRRANQSNHLLLAGRRHFILQAGQVLGGKLHVL